MANLWSNWELPEKSVVGTNELQPREPWELALTSLQWALPQSHGKSSASWLCGCVSCAVVKDCDTKPRLLTPFSVSATEEHKSVQLGKSDEEHRKEESQVTPQCLRELGSGRAQNSWVKGRCSRTHRCFAPNCSGLLRCFNSSVLGGVWRREERLSEFVRDKKALYFFQVI